jgi:dihydrofolate synthase/folylpolyglutamate synthase
MADLEERAARPLFLISGMLTTKDPVGFFKPFGGLARKVFTVPVASSNASRDPAELAEAARAAGLPAEPAASVEAAIDQISGDFGRTGSGRILICGSLYLAGSVLAANGTPPA